jgi:hypothetical protein
MKDIGVTDAVESVDGHDGKDIRTSAASKHHDDDSKQNIEEHFSQDATEAAADLEKDIVSKSDKKKHHGKEQSSTHMDYDSSGEDRKAKRNKSVTLDFQRNSIGEIIYKGHPSWVLMQCIQIGIRHSVGKNSELLRSDQVKLINDIHRNPSFFSSPKIVRFPS